MCKTKKKGLNTAVTRLKYLVTVIGLTLALSIGLRRPGVGRRRGGGKPIYVSPEFNVIPLRMTNFCLKY